MSSLFYTVIAFIVSEQCSYFTTCYLTSLLHGTQFSSCYSCWLSHVNSDTQRVVVYNCFSDYVCREYIRHTGTSTVVSASSFHLVAISVCRQVISVSFAVQQQVESVQLVSFVTRNICTAVAIRCYGSYSFLVYRLVARCDRVHNLKTYSSCLRCYEDWIAQFFRYRHLLSHVTCCVRNRWQWCVTRAWCTCYVARLVSWCSRLRCCVSILLCCSAFVSACISIDGCSESGEGHSCSCEYCESSC